MRCYAEEGKVCLEGLESLGGLVLNLLNRTPGFIVNLHPTQIINIKWKK